MTSILVDARIGWESGIGRYAANTVPLVAKRMPEVQFETLVVQREESRAREAFAGIPNLSVSVLDLPPFSLAEQWVLPARAKGHDLTWFVNYWVPLAFRSPFIAVVHDVLHLEPELFPAGRLKRTLSRKVFAHLAKNASGLSYDSRFTKREFESRFGPPRHSDVCGIGIDHQGWALFDPQQPPRKSPRLLVVAAAKKHKNFAIAVEAFTRAKLPAHWELTIITPGGPLRSSIDVDALAKADSRVQLMHGLSNDELRALYADTAILLMPSLYEGFGLPLAEGLQAGAQCISSAAESLVEIGQGAQITYVNGRDLPGWIEAIETECARFDNGAIDPETVSANMRHAMRYTWDRVAESTTAMLSQLLRG